VSADPQSPGWIDRLAQKFRDNHSAAISVLLHVILVALFGGTVLFQKLEPPSDFSADGGFVGDGTEEGTTPPGPPAIQPPSPDMSQAVMPTTPQQMPDMASVLTTTAVQPTFSMPSAPVPSASNMMAQMNSMALSAAKPGSMGGGGGSGSWGKSSGKGSWGKGFGSMEKDDMMLVGNLYDFKQSPDLKPLKTSLEDFWREIRGYIDSRQNPDRLKKYFRSKPIYTAQIFIPFRKASEGPGAFGLEAQVKPAMWMIHYRGGFTPGAAGKYRFWAQADDSLIAIVDGKVVLDVSRVNGPDGLSRPDGNPSRWKGKGADFKNDIPYPGDWIDLKAGQTYRLDILIAEGAPWGQVQRMLNGDKNAGVDGDLLGGDFEAVLMVEFSTEKNPKPGKAYSPMPVFATLPMDGAPPKSAVPGKDVAVAPGATVMTPQRNVLKGSSSDPL
jgi:hypothetical protein